MDRLAHEPRWARIIPAVQFGIAASYIGTFLGLFPIPERASLAFFYGTPLIFAAALGLGVVTARRRRTVRPDSSDSMNIAATLGNTLMGLGLGGSAVVIFFAWSLFFWEYPRL